MKSRRHVWFISLLAVLGLILSACAGDGEPDTAEDSTSSNEKGEGGDLVISIGADVVSLSTQGSNDIPSGNVAVNLYETLTTMDDNQEIQPGLAKDWEEVDDTTWDFHLKEDIKFHDGAEFNAEAVKKTFDRLMDDEIGSPRAFLLKAVESVEVKDDYTVRINLEYPYAPLLANLSHIGTAIMSPEVIEKDYAQMEEGGDVDAYINKHPAGTGPFKFKEWVPGDKVVITKNGDYWGEPAKLDTATFQVVSEQSTRLAQLDTGEADVADAIGPNNVSRMENTEGVHLLQEPSVSLSYIGFNVQKEPFDDVKVRKAVSMAINKESIIEGVYNGVGIPAKGPLPPNVFGYDDSLDGFDYDLEKAKELLAEAGYEDGFKTTIWTNDNEQRVDTAITVQSQLKEIGIEVQIEELEWGAYLERTANGEHDMFVLGWVVGTMDADYGLYPLFHSDSLGGPGNRTFLQNEEIDELLAEARRETDSDKRKELYSQAQEKLIELSPMVYLTHKEYLLGVSDSLKDFGIDALGYYEIKDAYIE
ncbi:Periplasmic oligopeptide-binding protein [Lentibacillus sp. JNUCC-1]|uniref:glutathione ABC transporter substrate-binding protein n=1 Tax=Lentibacillus sp. JNUCC-1 TaxID=2654513 RepID=UPI0012E7298A|nr:glutathione ABC transporter substrate-binding protein [Lentibacillus sp. JNUCC-1]MUV36724.1 Periplasmic oligopeptide-binding protein [Lentibacillus sp. JNUCC-1]